MEKLASWWARNRRGWRYESDLFVVVSIAHFSFSKAIALLVGAKEIHTLEYGAIHAAHPQIKTFLPGQFAAEIIRDGPR